MFIIQLSFLHFHPGLFSPGVDLSTRQSSLPPGLLRSCQTSPAQTAAARLRESSKCKQYAQSGTHTWMFNQEQNQVLKIKKIYGVRKLSAVQNALMVSFKTLGKPNMGEKLRHNHNHLKSGPKLFCQNHPQVVFRESKSGLELLRIQSLSDFSFCYFGV